MEELKIKLGDDVLSMFDTKVDEIVAWADQKLLQPMWRTGLLSSEGYNAIMAKNKKWAPFEVIAHLPSNPDKITVGSELFSVARQDVVKAMKGMKPEHQIISLYDALAKRIPATISLIERNKVARAMLAMKDQYPELAQVIVAAEKGVSAPRGWGSISAFINGKAEKFFVPEFLEDAMKQLSPVSTNLLGTIIGYSSAAFRAGATNLYIPFTISNAFRDYYMAKLTARYGFNMKNWLGGLYEGLKGSYGFETPFFRDVMEAKGGFAGWVQQTRNISTQSKQFFEPIWKKRIKNIVNPLQLLQNLSQAVEFAPRLGLAKRTLKAGGSLLDAAWDMRTGTIDFAKAGSLMRVWNIYVPFLNARLQGLLNVKDVAMKRPVHAAGIATQFAILPGLAAYAYNNYYHPELIGDVPQYIKDSYHYIITGRTYDEQLDRLVPQIATIPKGDVGQIFWNPIENALDYTKQKDPRSIIQLVTNWVSDISPVEFATEEGKPSFTRALGSTIPPIIKGPLEVAVNKDFFRDMPIIPERLEKIAAPEQYFEPRFGRPGTPPLLIKAGEKLGVSPIKMEHLIGSMLAGTGREAVAPGRLPEIIGRRFYRPAGGVIEKKAWEIINEGKVGYNTARLQAIRAMSKDDYDKAADIIAAWNSKSIKYMEKLEAMGLDSGKYGKEIYFDIPDKNRLVKEADMIELGIPALERRLMRVR